MLRIHDSIVYVGFRVPHSLVECLNITRNCVIDRLLTQTAKFSTGLTLR